MNELLATQKLYATLIFNGDKSALEITIEDFIDTISKLNFTYRYSLLEDGVVDLFNK